MAELPRYTQNERGLQVEAATYRLSFPPERPFAFLEDAQGRRWAELFLAPSLHTQEGLDYTAQIAVPSVQPQPGGLRVELELLGSRWRRKRLIFECLPDRLLSHTLVEGRGHLTDVHYFGGYYAGPVRWGSGWFGSGAGFRTVFNPEPSRAERRVHSAAESAAVDVGGVSLPGKEHWFFTPAPFCLAFNREAVSLPAWVPGSFVGADQGGTPSYERSLEQARVLNPRPLPPTGPWLMAGLATPPGQHTYSEYRYEAGQGAFSLRLSYEGQTAVDGLFQTPGLLFLFDQPDPYRGLERYAQVLEEMGLVEPTPAQPRRPAWWTEPIFCGWGAQCGLAVQLANGSRGPDLCHQRHYDRFLETLEAQGLIPGTVVIDDKWQRHYGTCFVDEEKWSDLPGWIRRRHQAGQRVLLWWKAWDPEGLEPEECVLGSLGQPIAADPSNPRYEATLRRAVRRMLLEYGADGFKVDFSSRVPLGPGLKHQGPEWGVELLHKLLWILYDEAKRVKPDSLVINHAPNPYFRDVADMIRLNDVNVESPVIEQMIHRAKVARAVCPGLLIDSDNWPMANRAAWLEYMRVQADLGIPALYFVSHFDFSKEPMLEEDFALVREVWERHRRGKPA